jgi:hypothetical protein
VTGAAPPPNRPVGYVERITPPWWVWLVGVCLPLPLAIAYGSAYGLWAGLVTAAVTTALVAWGLRATSPTISVTSAGISAGRALLPLSAVGGVRVLTPDELVSLRRGPRAFVTVRAWTSRGGVTVEVSDANDPHDRWVLTLREPVRFVAAATECLEWHGSEGAT